MQQKAEMHASKAMSWPVNLLGIQVDRYIGRQVYRQIGKQVDRYTGRQVYRQIGIIMQRRVL